MRLVYLRTTHFGAHAPRDAHARTPYTRYFSIFRDPGVVLLSLFARAPFSFLFPWSHARVRRRPGQGRKGGREGTTAWDGCLLVGSAWDTLRNQVSTRETSKDDRALASTWAAFPRGMGPGWRGQRTCRIRRKKTSTPSLEMCIRPEPRRASYEGETERSAGQVASKEGLGR